MKTKEYVLLSSREFKVLKVIQFEGPEWDYFLGLIPYLRTYDPKNYDHLKGDELDEKILSLIQERFPKSRFCRSEVIVFKEQLERAKKTMKSEHQKSLIFQFFGVPSYDEVIKLENEKDNVKVKGIDLDLKINFHYIKNPESLILNIQDVYTCPDLPFDDFCRLINSITPILD